MRNTQVSAYTENRILKQHEEEMLAHIKNENESPGKILDIGCADGFFSSHLAKEFPDSEILAFDIDETLIERANEKNEQKNVKYFCGDVLNYEPNTKFDAIIASGVLSIFDDFEGVLGKWLEWLNPKGSLFIFGRFNTNYIDTRISFRNHHTNGEWEGGLTAYGCKTVSDYLDQKNVSYNFNKFQLKFDLQKSDDPIRTYTVKTDDQKRMVVNGANIIAEHFYLTVTAK